MLIFFPTLLGILLFGKWCLEKSNIQDHSVLDGLIYGVLIFSSFLSFMYCFTEFDIAYLAVSIALLSLLINFRRVPALVKNLKYTDLNVYFIIFFLIINYFYLSPSYENILYILSNGGKLLTHIDFFHHASIVGQIKIQPEINNTQILLYQEKVPFYHYGIYIFPALIARLFNISSINAVMWIMFPLGILILGKSLFYFFTKLNNNNYFINLLSCLFILIISDTSRALFFNNSLFDLPYLIAASPGVIFGLGIIIYYLRFTIDKKTFNYNLFIITLIILLGFRALFLPLFFLYCTYLWALSTNKFSINLILIITAILIIVLLIIGNNNLIDFYSFMLTFPDSSIDLSAKFKNPVSIAFHVLYATLGGWILLLIFISAIILIIKYVKFRSFDNIIIKFFFLVLAYFITLLVPFPNPTGDSSEFLQRPFPVLNIISSVFLLTYISKNINYIYSNLLIILSIIFYLILNSRPHGFPMDHPWHISSYKVNVDPSIIEISKWLHNKSNESIYVYYPVNELSYSQYPEAIITGISQMPTLLSRVGFYISANSKAAHLKDIKIRLDFLKYLSQCKPIDGSYKSIFGRGLYIISEKKIECLLPEFIYNHYYVYHIPG